MLVGVGGPGREGRAGALGRVGGASKTRIPMVSGPPQSKTPPLWKSGEQYWEKGSSVIHRAPSLNLG